MDSIKLKKIEAMKRYRKQQLLKNLFLYSLTTLTCSLFCSSPFWYPPLCSCVNVFLFLSLPKITSLFFSSKFLFILGNLIVIFLVGESKFLYSVSTPANDVYYNEYVSRRKRVKNLSSFEPKEKEGKLEVCFEEREKSRNEDFDKGKEERLGEERDDLEGKRLSLCDVEDLNKRADNFIARVNKQWRLEVMLLVCGSD